MARLVVLVWTEFIVHGHVHVPRTRTGIVNAVLRLGPNEYLRYIASGKKGIGRGGLSIGILGVSVGLPHSKYLR